MREEFLRRVLFITPVALVPFFGHLLHRFPFNPFVPLLTLLLVRSRTAPPLYTACFLGLGYDLFLPSPRIGAYCLAYVLSTALMGAILRKISSTSNNPFYMSLVAGTYALFIEAIARTTIGLFGITTHDVSFTFYAFAVIPLGSALCTLALYTLLLALTRSSHARYR